MMKKSILIILSSVILGSFLFVNCSNAANVVIESNKQTYNEKTNRTNFDGNVKVGVDNIKVKSPNAIVKMGADGKPESAKFINGVYAIKNDVTSQSEIKANTMHLTLFDKKIIAEGHTKSMVSQNKKPIVTINANIQEFDMVTNTIKANGAVIMNYKDITTNSATSQIEVTPDGKLNKVNLNGNVKVIEKDSLINADNVIINALTNEFTAVGTVKSKTILSDSTPVYMMSDSQQYNKTSGTMMSSGNVKILYKDYVAVGPKAMIVADNNTQKPSKIIFVGRSNIQEGSRRIEADKIEITMNPKNFSAEGNVKTRFVQIDSTKGSPTSGKKSKKGNVRSIDSDLSNSSSFDKKFESVTNTKSIPKIKDDSFKTTPAVYDKVLNEKTYNK